MKLFRYLFMAIGCWILWSCDNTRVFEQNVDINNKSWHEDSVPGFTFNIGDSHIKYNLYYNIRNTTAYPYRNLYVQYTLEDSTGQVVSSDLHNINLFDPKTGEPLGTGMSDIQEHQVLALDGFSFPYSGKYHFKIQQYMRMQQLPEVLSIGLRVERSEQ